MDKEIEYVWNTPWSFGTVLYLLNRYLPFIDAFIAVRMFTADNSPEVTIIFALRAFFLLIIRLAKSATQYCHVSNPLLESLAAVPNVTQVVLMVRTYAIWGRKRSILGGLVTLALCTLVPAIVICYFEVHSWKYVTAPPPAGTICFATGVSKIIFLAYVFLICCETCIVVLTMIKGVQHLRQTRSSWIVKMYKDGLLFYFYNLGVRILPIMRFRAAIAPIFEIQGAIRIALWPTMVALWHNPALWLAPSTISQLFMAHVWGALSRGYDADPATQDLKRKLIYDNAHGAVLDLGAGYGYTAKYLDRSKVTTYIALEPNTLMHPAIRAIAGAAGFTEKDGTLLILACGAEDTTVIQQLASVGQPHCIDTIISVLTLCTIPRPEATMQALVRDVLRSGGMLLFYEHVLSPRADVARAQQFWTPMWRVFFDGCRLNRPSHLWVERISGWDKKEVWGKEGESEENVWWHRLGKFLKA
ncbi:hypothetical protein HWV62_20224 [Athelia sp. TMB]|nr:hypothetical protein HWV62_20224 [Athelia sp. TMB]